MWFEVIVIGAYIRLFTFPGVPILDFPHDQSYIDTCNQLDIPLLIGMVVATIALTFGGLLSIESSAGPNVGGYLGLPYSPRIEPNRTGSAQDFHAFL